MNVKVNELSLCFGGKFMSILCDGFQSCTCHFMVISSELVQDDVKYRLEPRGIELKSIGS